MSFAKNMGKNMGKNISKNLTNKYNQILRDNSKHSATDALKTAESTGDLIGNKIADYGS